MSIYTKWAQTKHSSTTHILAMLMAGVVFLILLPLLIIRLGPKLDEQLGLAPLELGAWSYIIGGILLVVGLSFGLWSNYVQLTRGRGTPLPMLPTQELLVRGPYRYCRNPMTLGTILAYLGIAIGAGTIAGIGLVLLFGLLLVFYLKRFEERELAERFGEAYLRYKQEVPFMIPRPPNRK